MLNLIKIQKINTNAVTPVKGTRESTGYDLSSSEHLVLPPGHVRTVSTGLVLDLSKLPEIVDVQIRPRSGLAAKQGITVLNTPGTIDRDYRGEIRVILVNHGVNDFTINPGDRIAQMVFGLALPYVTFVPVETIDENTERGSGGFGSTSPESKV